MNNMLKSNGLREFLLNAGGIFIIFLSLLFFSGVILRYILRVSFGELQIAVRICISWCVFLSGAAAFESKKHLALDIFDVGKLKSSWLRKGIVIISNLVILFVVLCITISSYNSFLESMKRIEPINRMLNQSYFYLPFLVGSILLLLIHINTILIKPITVMLKSIKAKGKP